MAVVVRGARVGDRRRPGGGGVGGGGATVGDGAPVQLVGAQTRSDPLELREVVARIAWALVRVPVRGRGDEVVELRREPVDDV
ncbi:hypothetical protein LP422_23050 [Janibacter limosus]|uniref:hypothetical protein n=1 Tax=Janibacter limosus TaxID=53458 RepID=UPI0035D562A0|nr:hypothetical protein LP422_23050 [Janibacter limosus]